MASIPFLSAEAVTALIAGAAGLGTGHFTRRTGRLARLEREVEECKERDARVVVIEAGFRLLVGALVRLDPNCPELVMCGQLLNRRLPVKEGDRDLSSFEELLAALDKPKEPDNGGPA